MVDPIAPDGDELKRCAYCAERIQAAAIICRFCGREQTLRSTVPLSEDSQARTLTVGPSTSSGRIAGVVLLIVVAAQLARACWPSDNNAPGSTRSAASPPTKSRAELESVYIDTLTADELYDRYRKNEVEADLALKGHRVLILGIVKSVQKDFLDHAYLDFTLITTQLGSVHAWVDDPREVATVRPGQRIDMVCTLSGMTLGDVIGRQCILRTVR